MKKITLLIIFSLNIFLSAHAQETRINLYGGYVFDDNYDVYYDINNYYSGKVKGGFQYGGGLEFMVQPDYGVELLYLGQMTHAPTYYYTDGYLYQKYTDFDLNLNYAMLCGTRHMQPAGSKAEGYGGFMAGALFANARNPDNGTTASTTRFAWGVRLGGNIWVSDKVGIKMQAQLLSAVQSIGGSFYFGTGGSGVAVTGYSSMLQFSLSSGLVFRFGK